MADDLPELSGREKWLIVRAALDSWNRTARLCVIVLIANVPLDVIVWIVTH